MNARTDAVRRFYEEAPFPGYPPRDSLSALRARAERSAFASLLDRAIAGDARVIDVGCGTGQMSLYLTRADRFVVAADMTHASLRLGAAAARRFGLDRVQFVEMDLQQPSLGAGTFDVVYSSGVVHHTADPRRSFAALVPLARPGGVIVLGVYNAVARLPTHARRLIARLTRFAVIPFDPVLKERASEPERARAWMRDQYRHPEEHCHTIAEVQRWFAENGVEYLRTYPSAVLEDEPDELFAPAPDNWAFENWLAQLSWMPRLGREGGLFFVIGRRR